MGIIAPSSPPFEEADVEFSLAWLQKLGLKTKVSQHIFDSYSDMAGVDEVRLAEFHQMWKDPEVQAILPVRGGNGAARLLPGLDIELIRQHPKIFIGYSDLTCLVNFVHQQTGLVTFHGPMAGSFYRSAYSHHYFSKALFSNRAIGLVVDPISADLWNPTYPPPRVVISPGRARGPLVGGCLTLIRQLLGTPYEIETDGKILFIEDVGEEPYSIDRYLTQLLLAGSLQNAKAILVAECVNCKPGDSGRNTLSLNRSVESVLRERLGDLGIPVVYGLRFGHGNEQFTLPIGINASLDANARGVKFRIEESATI